MEEWDTLTAHASSLKGKLHTPGRRSRHAIPEEPEQLAARLADESIERHTGAAHQGSAA